MHMIIFCLNPHLFSFALDVRLRLPPSQANKKVHSYFLNDCLQTSNLGFLLLLLFFPFWLLANYHCSSECSDLS